MNVDFKYLFYLFLVMSAIIFVAGCFNSIAY